MLDNKSYSNILIFILLIINVTPAYSLQFSTLRTIISGLQIICFFIVVLLYLRNSKMSKVILLISLFYFMYIFSTMLNAGNYQHLLRIFMSGFSLCAGTELLLFYNNSKKLIKSACIYFQILIYINFVTILLFPSGLYETENINPYYFLGHRNDSIEYILPACCLTLLYSYINKRSFGMKVLAVISIATVILTWSVNAMLALTVFYIYSLFPTKKYVSKIIGFKSFFITSIVLFVSFIIFRLQYLFEWFIVNVLKRSTDFTYRTGIWDETIYYINNSLVFGYGYESGEIKELKIGHPNSGHNYYLDFLYNGGVLLLGTFFVLIFFVGKAIEKCEDMVLKNIFIGVCGGYFLLGFATPFHRETVSIMFLIFTIIYNYKYITKNLKE